MVHLEIPHSLGEQACRNQVKEASGDDQENLQRREVPSPEMTCEQRSGDVVD